MAGCRRESRYRRRYRGSRTGPAAGLAGCCRHGNDGCGGPGGCRRVSRSSGETVCRQQYSFRLAHGDARGDILDDRRLSARGRRDGGRRSSDVRRTGGPRTDVACPACPHPRGGRVPGAAPGHRARPRSPGGNHSFCVERASRDWGPADGRPARGRPARGRPARGCLTGGRRTSCAATGSPSGNCGPVAAVAGCDGLRDAGLWWRAGGARTAIRRHVERIAGRLG